MPISRLIPLILILYAAACSPMHYTEWVPNLACVDASIYRSGQITDARGWAYVARIAGGRTVTVVKLNYDSEGSDSLPGNMILDYEPIEPAGDAGAVQDVIDVFDGPDEAHVQRALAALDRCRRDPAHRFCLVHCTHGQDRTGYVVGRFRVAFEGWSKARAFDEMLEHDFHVELVGLLGAWLAH